MVATASACQARGLALGISPWGTLEGALSMSRDTEKHGTTATCVANFQGWMRAMPVVADGSRVSLDQALYSFDLSEYGLVGAFSTSGCLYAVTAEQSLDFRALFESLADSGIEVWVSTPSFEDLCLADPSFSSSLMPSLRLFLFCGEALHHTTVERLAERFCDARIANTYGPTESTVAVTFCEIGASELADPSPLPVGYPRPGTELRIVDHETGAPLPQGQTGEIVIVGDTVAHGYYESPEKTAEAFFESHMQDGPPMTLFADPSFFLLLVPTIAGAAALVALELASSGMRPGDFGDFYPEQALITLACCTLPVAAGVAKPVLAAREMLRGRRGSH